MTDEGRSKQGLFFLDIPYVRVNYTSYYEKIYILGGIIMIRLRIVNWFSAVDGDTGEVLCSSSVKPFDLSKYGDGCVHEFETIGECRDFVHDCDIEFTEDYESQFTGWDWEEIHTDLWFDRTDNNMLVLHITCSQETRD